MLVFSKPNGLKQGSLETFTLWTANLFLSLSLPFDVGSFSEKADAGMGYNSVKSCLKVGVLEAEKYDSVLCAYSSAAKKEAEK